MRTGWPTAPQAAIRRCFDAVMAVCENLAGDVLASRTVQWSTSSKAWAGGAGMADASLNRRMTVRLGLAVANAQIGIVGFDGQIELEREFAAEVAWDLPSLAPGATSLLDVTVTDCRQGGLADAALASPTRFVELDAAALDQQHGPRDG